MAGNQSYVCTWYVGEGMIQIWLCQMADNQAYEKGKVQSWFFSSNGWNSIVCVCTVFGGGCGPNLDLIVSNCWKSILCVCMACRGRVRSKPDCVKWLEINSMCVHGMWRRVRYKPDCFKWLEINHLCAWYVEEGTVQTWLCQIAGNQCYVFALHVGGGYGPNLIASNALKSILCVHGLWTRVRSKPDCVKWLEINSICVHGMWRRVQYKPDCFKWLEINHLCAWYVEEGTVQTWLCQMAGNQAYVCTWYVKEATVQTWLCQMAGNQAYMCA